VSRRTWAAMMIARDVHTCGSVLRGLPVFAANLDGEVLRRALRGGSAPPPSEFIVIDKEMLDAVAEAGPLTPRRTR
jgi:hypothetical protein